MRARQNCRARARVSDNPLKVQCSQQPPGPIIVARGRVRARKGVAIEPSVDARSTHLVDHLEIPHVQVHVGLDGQLARGAHDGEPGCHRACATCEAVRWVKGAETRFQRRRERTCSNEPSSVEDEDAAPRAVKGELDRGEAAGSEIRIRAARADGVQVERQLEAGAGDGDRFGELPVQYSHERLRVCANGFKCAE